MLRRSPIKRGKPPKAVNKKRKKSEWARAYHSEAFVRFTKSAPCAADGRTPCDAAHTESGGAGRKADWDTIIPLCSGINGCHAKQHREGWAAIGMSEEGRKRAVAYHQAAWAERGLDAEED
jgi:hypothetical protein